MLLARSLSAVFVASLLVGLTGCVGPMANGPLGGCTGPACSSNNSACTGCGELYVDPWVNHPADCVDPCNTCGNYNGQSCGSCRPLFSGIRSLWGYRCDDACDECVGPVCFTGGCGALNGGGGCGCGGSCGCDSGCDGGCSCGAEVIGPACGCEPACGIEASCGFEGGGEVLYGQYDGEVIDGGQYTADGVPTPARELSIQPANQPYKPERERKIFNPRPRVATGDGREIGY